jgi:hypothetical protein
MIAFDKWLPQIIDYCGFILDDEKLRRAWIDRDFSETSVTNFDELCEQIFDDLDADNLVVDFSSKLQKPDGLQASIMEFLSSLHAVDFVCTLNQKPNDVQMLLDSAQWQRVRSAALNVLNMGVGAL